MALFNLMYISTLTVPLDNKLLQAIQGKAILNNQQNEITGILLYGKGQFLQVLEGDVAEVSSLFAKIYADPRHDNITCLHFGPASERHFPSWSMGVFNLEQRRSAVDVQELRAALEEFSTAAYGSTRYDKMIQLLERFRMQVSDSDAA